jgi:NADH-quinone oxidoreductase subunit N
MFDVKPPTIDWGMIAPVTIVMITGIVGLIIEMLRPKQNNNAIVVASLSGLGIAIALLFGQIGLADGSTLAEMVYRDRVGTILQMSLVGVAFLSILFSEGYLREKRIPFGEFYPLLLWSVSGAMIMVSTKSLLMLFIGLEVLSIALYVMAGLSRREAKSEESAIKYFLLGSFASGFLLYGISFIYGATGSLSLDAIAPAWEAARPDTKNLLIFGLGLIVIAFSFKSAFVPFHQWTPDVYQGAPTNVTAFMAAGSKIAAIGAFYRVMESAAPMKDIWIPALFWIAVATMTIGNLAAVVQKDVKRILGYSSISNAGYLLAALIAHLKMPDKIPATSVLFFLVNYSLMTLGIFAVISLVAARGKESTQLKDLNGLGKRHPLAAVALVLFVVALIGIPPTGGFFAKYMVFQDLLTADMLPLALVLAVNSVISVYYYLAIAYAAYVAEEGTMKPRIAPMNSGVQAATLICMAGVVIMGLMNSPIVDFLGASR